MNFSQNIWNPFRLFWWWNTCKFLFGVWMPFGIDITFRFATLRRFLLWCRLRVKKMTNRCKLCHHLDHKEQQNVATTLLFYANCQYAVIFYHVGRSFLFVLFYIAFHLTHIGVYNSITLGVSWQSILNWDSTTELFIGVDGWGMISCLLQ